MPTEAADLHPMTSGRALIEDVVIFGVIVAALSIIMAGLGRDPASVLAGTALFWAIRADRRAREGIHLTGRLAGVTQDLVGTSRDLTKQVGKVIALIVGRR